MPSFYPSANMNMPIPVVGVDPGPNWALNINASLTVVDSHDHSVGKGVQITPAGMNINASLVINQNDIVDIRTVRFTPQGSVSGGADLGCLYVLGDDLFYRDISGTQVQITVGGNVNSGAGSIAGLVSPASANYVSVSNTFVWQSGVNIAANMDMRSAILRNGTASSNKLTLEAPTLTSDYTLTLPNLPLSTAMMILNSSGTISTTAYPQLKSQTFTANGSWTTPANVTQVILIGYGGGGGGGGSLSGSGGGGGCGAMQFSAITTVVPTTSYTVGIGSGGTGGGVNAFGNPGNSTNFGNIGVNYVSFAGAVGGNAGSGVPTSSPVYTLGGTGSSTTTAEVGRYNAFYQTLGGIPGTGSGAGGGGGGGAGGAGAVGGNAGGNGNNASANSGAGGGGCGNGGTTGGNGGSGKLTILWVE